MDGFDHDYSRYPELTNTELQILGLTSPHAQITEDFVATVVKVHDGDTVTLETEFRDFAFPIRLLEINAPELNEDGGKEAQAWLESQILGQVVEIIIEGDNRVDKYGRLLGHILYNGSNMAQTMIYLGLVKPFEARNEGKIPNFNKELMEASIENGT